MAGYDPALAASLQSLALRAVGPLSALEVLPAPFSLISLITGTTAQGFFAVAQSGNTTQLVLAVGAQWPDWIVAQAWSPALTLSILNPAFYSNGGAAAGAQFDLTVQSLYMAMRPALLTQLEHQAVNQVPVVSLAELLVCGQGVGAALAQLAAFDLRAQNAGQGLKFAAVRCYAYSPPALANSALQAQFSQQIPDAWSVTASAASPVDLFPSQPTASSGFIALGTAQTLAATLPKLDDPWWERSGPFYRSAFANAESAQTMSAAAARQRSTSMRAARVSASALPSGYSADTAVTMARLVSVVNQLAEHPNLPLDIPQPWSLSTAFAGAYGALFSCVYPKAYAIAFRAGVSYEETASVLTLVGPVGPDYLPAGAVVHSGAASTYGNLRTALRAQLAGLDFSGGATLYVSGHSLGGIVAGLCAGDLFCNPVATGAPVPFTYCFGAPSSVGFSYASAVCSSGSCALQAQTYLVARDRDTVARVDWQQLVTSYGNPVSLSGVTPYDDEAFHSLSSYVALLSAGV